MPWSWSLPQPAVPALRVKGRQRQTWYIFGNGRQLDHQLELVPNSTRTRNLMSMLSREGLAL